MSELLSAIASGSTDAAVKAITDGCEVNVVSDDGSTPLHWAVSNADVRCVQLLLQRRADPCAEDSDGLSPLHIACANGLPDVARCILQHHADVNLRTSAGLSALHIAASAGDDQMIKLLASLRANVAFCDTSNGRTPLHAAAAAGHASCITALLDAGSSSDARDVKGLTPLQLAIKAGHTVCAFLLTPPSHPNDAGQSRDASISRRDDVEGQIARCASLSPAARAIAPLLQWQLQRNRSASASPVVVSRANSTSTPLSPGAHSPHAFTQSYQHHYQQQQQQQNIPAHLLGGGGGQSMSPGIGGGGGGHHSMSPQSLGISGATEEDAHR